MPLAIVEYDQLHGLDLSTYACAEAQAAAIADDIAYNTHDIDDGLRRASSLADLASVPLVGDLVREIERALSASRTGRMVHELGRRVITRFVEDVIAESRRRLATLRRQAPPTSARPGARQSASRTPWPRPTKP